LKKRALISVSDKSGVVNFAKELVGLGFEIISTGGTYKTLKDNNIAVVEANEVTKFPECFEGRVKTLNPYIHGGILHRRDKQSHLDQAKELGIEGIDLVCVNLYPFKATIEKTDDFEEIIENIDIGGPAMVRSAAKNFDSVIIITDVADYDLVLQNLKNDTNTVEFRRDLMIKAYEHTAAYDSMIANYMNKRFNNGFGDKTFIVGNKVFDTRYGENPHQKGALYEFEKHFSNNFKIVKGEPSFNNMGDISGAAKIASAFGDDNAVCIVKHGNPCGFAIKDTLLESYTEALKCDPVSAFGGVVAVNGIVELDLAKKMNEIFLEVVFAADFTHEAVEELSRKQRIKLFSQGTKKLVMANDEIKNGNTYLLNLTAPTKISSKLTLEEIYNITNAKFKLLYKDKFVCFSPERFIKIIDNEVFTYPMKGTINADIPNAKQKILDDKKELAEHIMVVDLLRNDLSVISKNVQVTKFRYIDEISTSKGNLYQVSSEIKGKLTSDWKANIGNILDSLLPAGSISGAPKKKTLEIIEKIEDYDRGFFTGIFGYFDGKSFDSGVLIRYIEKTRDGLVYKSGGGITLDSDDLSEYDELISKVYLS